MLMRNYLYMEKQPGVSVFIKDENGDIYHTYSAYARGLEMLLEAITLWI
jgi:predicted dithiol-disulfide oxidoreductase (DUF899 family)